jgi:hypothetical protein
MASTQILGVTLSLTPTMLTVLRIAPLLSTTASITHAYMEWLTNSSCIWPAPVRASSTKPKTAEEARAADAELEKSKDIVVPIWFTNFFNTGVISVIGLNSITLISSSLNAFAFSKGLGPSRKFYQIGLVAALGHYAFVPLVANSVWGLMEMCTERVNGKETDRGKGKAEAYVREWVGAHKIRMATVDLLAWVCFWVGCVGAVTV